MSPVTPAELLVALHNIDPSKAELKYVIKGMHKNCFSIFHSSSLSIEIHC